MNESGIAVLQTEFMQLMHMCDADVRCECFKKTKMYWNCSGKRSAPGSLTLYYKEDKQTQQSIMSSCSAVVFPVNNFDKEHIVELRHSHAVWPFAMRLCNGTILTHTAAERKLCPAWIAERILKWRSIVLQAASCVT